MSGIFRAAGDFATLYLRDADDFYGHKRFRYLPDFDLSGVVLTFDVLYDGLQPLDSAKFDTISWGKLSVIKANGVPTTIPLFPFATQVGGTYTAASAVFTVATPGAVAFDRVTLWYQNFAFDFISGGGESAATVAVNIAAQINAISWGANQAITATAVGANITVTAAKAGIDGNMIRLYCQSKNANLTIDCAGVDFGQLTGGSSAATWRVVIDFDALAISMADPDLTSIRQAWMTLAPPLADSAATGDLEFSAVFTNWTVTGSNKALQVAGPGSVRVEDSDSWCTYSGSSWDLEAGFFSLGFARRATTPGDNVKVRYFCSSTHDLYVGTSLYSDRGRWTCTIDGGAPVTLDCYLSVLSAVVTRRKIASAVPPGEHFVTLTVDAVNNGASSGFNCYFDFLEAAVPSDVPDPLPALANIRPANDYGTDHTYKRSPARVQWDHEQLGFGAAPWNVYVSVFWEWQMQRVGAVFPAVVLDFSQTAWASTDAAFIDVGGQVYGKSVFPADDASSIARHFAFYVNEQAVGVWASASGPVLTITLREVGSAYSFTFSAYKEVLGPVDTALTFTGSLMGGTYGKWFVDPLQSPALNRGARDWLADLCAVCAAASVDLTLAYSMEILNPPDNPPTDVWAARYPDNTPVQTATGFGTNFTTHCSFVSKVLAFQTALFLDTAAIMDAAGLPVQIQCGEWLWWYFANVSGMAFYDAETAANALVVLGAPLHTFLAPNDDPSLHSTDVSFLQAALDNHIRSIRTAVVAIYPTAKIELLLPLDVTAAAPYGPFSVGGRLNHAVSIPATFHSAGAAPFDMLKVEALDHQVSSRDQNRARVASQFAFTAPFSWATARYIVGVYNGGAPWATAIQESDSRINCFVPYAMDHVCLFSWEFPEGIDLATSAL